MITETKLIQKLTNIRISYGDVIFNPTKEKVRFLGAMEMSLIILGELEFGEPLPYKNIECIEYNLFKKNGTYNRKETYQELIIRLVDNVVKK